MNEIHISTMSMQLVSTYHKGGRMRGKWKGQGLERGGLRKEEEVCVWTGKETEGKAKVRSGNRLKM